jgi:hypothetical protein
MGHGHQHEGGNQGRYSCIPEEQSGIVPMAADYVFGHRLHATIILREPLKAY